MPTTSTSKTKSKKTVVFQFLSQKTKNKLNKDKKKEREFVRRKLIKVEVDKWLTVEQYSELLKNFDTYRQSLFVNGDIDTFCDWIVENLKVRREDISYVDIKNGSVHSKYGFKPEQLLKKYKSGFLFSTPETGQDPKGVNIANIKDAEYYAGTQWLGLWERPIYINIVVYPKGNGKNNIVFSVVDGEHRTWGILGFQLDAVKLRAPDGYELEFYMEDKMIKPIDVDGLYLSEIVQLANDFLRTNSPQVTEDDVLARFNKYSTPVNFLPMFDKIKCGKLWARLNKASNNTKAQDLHADPSDSNSDIKTYSSLKCHEFPGSNDVLHKFYQLFPESDHVELKTFMITHLVIQYLMERGFVSSQDCDISKRYYDSGEYADWYETNKPRVIEALNFLYDLFKNVQPKYRNCKYISKQKIQLALKFRDYCQDSKWRIFDYEQLISDFNQFIDDHRVNDDGTKTSFGSNLSQSGRAQYNECWAYMLKEFITHDEEKLGLMGICPVGETVPRFFSKRIIKKMLKKYDSVDVDGYTILDIDSCQGGHRIAHDILKNLSDAQRNELAIIEDFESGKFTFEENCRPISSELNNIQGVLSLSEFQKLMSNSFDSIRSDESKFDEWKELVRNRAKEYKEETLSRYNDYRKGA